MIVRQGYGGKFLCTTIHTPPAADNLLAEHPLIGIMPVIFRAVGRVDKHVPAKIITAHSEFGEMMRPGANRATSA
jgi:hypothetical protein